MKWCYLFSVLLIILFSCNKVSKYAVIPKISFNSISLEKVKAGFDTTFFVYVNFEDGDGDIGFGSNNIYFIDTRDKDTVAYEIPVIPERFEPKKGIQGSFQVEINAASLLLRSDSIHKENDTLVWNIYMVDQAQHQSNVISSKPLFLTK